MSQILQKNLKEVSLVVDDNDLSRKICESYSMEIYYVSTDTILPKDLEKTNVLVLDIPPSVQSFLYNQSNISKLSYMNESGLNIVTLGHFVQNAHFIRTIIDLYPHQEIHAANYFEGPDFLILRPEFEDDPCFVRNSNEVLISMGGSDPHDLTGVALEILHRANFKGKARAVLGPGYTKKNEWKLRQKSSQYAFTIQLEHNVRDMRAMMRHAALGFSAFGTTAYEMMSQRLPAMVFTHYKWQEPSAQVFEKMGCCILLGCAEDGVNQSSLSNKVAHFLSDKGAAIKMAEKGRSIVDGCGAKRVTNILSQLEDENGDQQLDIVYVLAHPGDELFGCGGTLLKQIRAGNRVGLMILGEGVSSRRKEADEQEVIVTARKEIRSALQEVVDKINLTTLYYYRFKDNRFDGHDLLDLIKVVEAIFKRHRPKTVYTHHPGDLNIDHRRTFEAVITAARPSARQSVNNIYSIEMPSSTDWGIPLQKEPFLANYFVDISEVLEEKMNLLTHYSTEICDDPHPRSLAGIRDRARQWGRTIGRQAAEAFVLQRGINE